MNFFKASIFLLLFLLVGSPSLSAQDQMEQALHLYQTGLIDDAIKEINQFIKSNPDNPGGYINKGIMIRQKGIKNNNSKYYFEARDLFLKADGLTQDQSTQIIIKGNLGTTYLEMKQYNEAKNAFNEAFNLSNRYFYKARVAYCLAKEGRFKEAYAIIESVSKNQLSSADSKGNQGLTLFNFGIVYALGRQPKEATRWLEAALTQNKMRFTYGIRQDTDLANIKSSSEFQNLLNKYPL